LRIRFIYPGAEWAYGISEGVRSDPFSPPLGLLYLASVLKAAGHDVTVTDFYAEPYTKKRLKEVLSDAEVVGMTLTSFTLKHALPLAKAIKAVAPKVPLIIGGPHVTLYPEKSLEMTPADISVAGEAEDIIVPIIKAIQEGGPANPALAQIPGVTFRTKEGLVKGPEGSYVKDLDRLPFPNRKLVEDNTYGYLLGTRVAKGRFTTLISSRGCPMRCRFCTRAAISMRKYRVRSAQNVLREIKGIAKAGYKTIMFVDDNFLANKHRAKKILDGIIKADLGLEIFAQGRVDSVNEELFTAMSKAGVRVLLLGIESGNQDVLDFYNKKTTLEQIENCVRMARKHGIISLGYFILGAPIEDEEHFQRSIDFAKSLPLDLAYFFQLELASGSPMWIEAVQLGIIKEEDHLVFAGKDVGYGKVDSSEIFKWVKKAHKSFYGRPWWWLDHLWQAIKMRDIRVLRAIGHIALDLKHEVFDP
jgi:anaerobic magnesium-protoporphyrin IX monomethyl ester cyclase